MYVIWPILSHARKWPQLLLLSISCFEEERRLDIDEKPLVVQLNWNKDDREGRFVLKNENDAIPAKVGAVPMSVPCSPGLGQWSGQGSSHHRRVIPSHPSSLFQRRALDGVETELRMSLSVSAFFPNYKITVVPIGNKRDNGSVRDLVLCTTS